MLLSLLEVEIKHKKISKEETVQLQQIEESCYKTLDTAVCHINDSCGSLSATLSPNVANIQMHLNVFEDRNKEDISLASNGLMNYNICLNTETEQQHTECDSSYTIICVPNQILNNGKYKNKNSGSFEFVINPQATIAIPMCVGTILTYSGYLLTHRQQICKKDLNAKPFVNIISYHSKRLFENMMQFFRRYLGDVKFKIILFVT